MKHTVEFRNWNPDARIRELLDVEIGRLQRLTRSLPQESLSLRVVVDRNEARTLYRVSLTVALPGHSLSASEERHRVKDAIHDAFAGIRHQLEKYRRKVTHVFERKRPARRERLRPSGVIAR